MAKSIAGGLPMGALAFGPRTEVFPPGAHGATFGGNPLACAAAVATIGSLIDERLPARATETGAYLLARLRELDPPPVRVVRGRGLMIGLERGRRARPVSAALHRSGVL